MRNVSNSAGFSLRANTGFSIPELMVVVVIIGILTTLALPRLRAFIARGRQAEAKNLLAQLHTLQTTHQNFKDQFARWGSESDAVTSVDSAGIGKGGVCTYAPSAGTCSGGGTPTPTTYSACNTGGGTWTATVPGAYELGFKPQNCSQLRYNYWVLRAVDSSGIERYVAYAFSLSETNSRIFPTCNGAKTSPTRSDTIKHPETSVQTSLIVTVAQGDLIALDEDKNWYHSDIIPYCE